jgi:hypothetical protein
MSQSKYSEHQKEVVRRYACQLACKVCGGGRRQLPSEEHRLTEAVLQKLRAHRFLDTDPREVENRLER